LDEIKNAEPHDIQMDYCISHLGIHQFENA
jgi:hypothetical protein